MTSTQAMSPPAGPAAQPELEQTYKKILFRLIPFLMVLWILAWIDRVNIGFVKLTMLDDLKWSEAIYGLGAGIFFLGYFFFEVPSNLLLQKIGAKKTIMRITIGWGLTSIAMMFVKTPEMFYFLRFLLGVFEAGFYPGIILYLTYWFPNDRRAKAFGMFMSASALRGRDRRPAGRLDHDQPERRQRLGRLAVGVPDRGHPVGDRRCRHLLLPDRQARAGQVADGTRAPAGARRPRARPPGAGRPRAQHARRRCATARSGS